MGFLDEGKTLSWAEVKKVAPYVRDHGIEQLLHIWKRVKDRKRDQLKWGDEVEYIVVIFDEERKTVRLDLRAYDVMVQLQQEEHDAIAAGDTSQLTVLWRPEYGRFMVEATPGQPFGPKPSQIIAVEESMRSRRLALQGAIGDDAVVLSVTHFPLFGVGMFTEPPNEPMGPIAMSHFVPDDMINPHRRFGTLTKNIRDRRGSKVAINIPLFYDEHTKDPVVEHEGQLPKHIYMDAMGFGMGSSCVQCTFQCCNIDEARQCYDQFVVLSPIMLALTAACPISRGMLSDNDVRWDIISAAVDDRTPEERGTNGRNGTIAKSRYDSVSAYISNNEDATRCNDVPLQFSQKVFDQLMQNGFDEGLARHFAHLFIRDPLVVYEGKVELDDAKHSDHFENIQSTNWQTARFKPPPPGSDIGWRVEFRPMELQLTEFENAAFVCFIVCMTRVLLAYDLNFYMPISLVDQNMRRAHRRDAVRTQRFHFRKHVTRDVDADAPDANEVVELSIGEIINGKEGVFVGLLPLVRTYLDSVVPDAATMAQLSRYLRLVERRASGELHTTATWMRDLVRSHHAYAKDSIVPPEVAYDLLRTCHGVTNGSVRPEALFGSADEE